MTRTPRRLALTAGLALLLLTGCGDGEVRPGAAAVVGDERITTDELQQLADRGLADPQAQQQLGNDLAGYQRLVLSRLINRELLEQAAQVEGVTVNDGDVAAEVEKLVQQAGDRAALEAQAAQGGIAAQDIAPFIRDVVLDQALGDALTRDVDVPRAQLEELYQQNIEQYDKTRARHILVQDEAQARTIFGNVQRDPEKFAALAAQFSQDTSNKDQGGQLPLAGRGRFDPMFEEAIFGADEGELLLVQTSFGWHVVEVQERQTTPLQEALPELRRIALGEDQRSEVQALLLETGDRLGVKVNPRFGKWDATTAQVVPDESPNGVLTPAPDAGAEDPLGGDPGGAPGEQPGGAPGEQPPGAPGEAPADAPAPAEPPVEPPAPSPAS